MRPIDESKYPIKDLRLIKEKNQKPEGWNKKVISEANIWHSKVREYSFSRIPNALFEYSGVFELSPEELGFLCILLSHMRYKDLDEGTTNRIYPSLSRLADYKINSTRQRLSNLKTSLEEKSLIKCTLRSGGNYDYDPSGLFALLHFLVEKDKELKKRLEYEYDQGGIVDRKDADEYRFSELKIALSIKKSELGI